MKIWLALFGCCAFAGTLDGDSLARILEKQFKSFLLYDVEAHQVVAGAGMDDPAAIGSLMKPFLALAYTGQSFPEITCDGTPLELKK